MELQIKISNKGNDWNASIFIDGKWFKEVGGLPSKKDLITAIGHSLSNDMGFTDC